MKQYNEWTTCIYTTTLNCTILYTTAIDQLHEINMLSVSNLIIK